MSAYVLIVAFSIVAFTYLIFGFHIFLPNPKNTLNVTFFLVAVFLTLTSLLGIAIQTKFVYQNLLHIRIAAIAGSAGFCYLIYLLLMYYIVLTDLIKPKWYIWCILGLMPLFINIRLILLKDVAEFTLENGFVQFKSITPFLRVMNFYLIVYTVLMMIILVIWIRRSSQRKQRLQGIIILTTQLIVIAVINIDTYYLFHFFKVFEYKAPGVASIYFIIWYLGIAYAMRKLRLMNVNLAYINQDIISHIEEFIIMLSSDNKINFMNKKSLEIFGTDSSYVNMPLASFVKESESYIKELVTLTKNGDTSISCRLNFITKSDGYLMVDAKTKMVFDKYNDMIGYLVIAHEVKEAVQMQKLYKITSRELEIIQFIISGKTNHEIAETLHISERTVKSHITHIFNKLAVDNRVQLILLLKDYNMIPEQQAEKIKFHKNHSN